MKSKPRWMKSVIEAAKAETKPLIIGRNKAARAVVAGKVPVKA